MRETEQEKVLVIINFSYEKPFEVDIPIEKEDWKVLFSDRFELGKTIALPDTLQPFEIGVFQKV